MKRVVLTSGPRGAGKSTFIADYVSHTSGVQVLSRDELLVELYGTTMLDRYTGDHHYASQLFSKKVEDVLETHASIDLIVDYWNGYADARRALIDEYRRFGADRVICWKFVTPKDVCVDWFMNKEDAAGYTRRMVARDYDLYHTNAKSILNDGFDSVRYVNPTQLEIPF